MNQPTPVTALTMISRGMYNYKQNLPLYLKIALFCMLFPQIMHQLFFAHQADKVVQNLQGKFAQLTTIPHWQTLLDGEITGFMYSYGFSYLLIGLLFIIGYYAIIDHAIAFSKSQVTNNLSTALKRGIALTLPKGMILGFFVGFLGLVSNFIMPPLIFIFGLTLMIPVLYVTEGRGILASIKNSLFLNYAPNIENVGGPWRAFFTLSGIIGFFYISIIFNFFLFDMVSELESILPASFWFTRMTGFPFSMLQFIQHILLSSINVLILSLLPVVCVELYFSVRQRVERVI